MIYTVLVYDGGSVIEACDFPGTPEGYRKAMNWAATQERLDKGVTEIECRKGVA